MTQNDLTYANLTASDFIDIERNARAMQAKVLRELVVAGWGAMTARLSGLGRAPRTA